ncbi:MAG: sugar phosphate isomerase/epimerase [Desulfobacula sp.]|uniref:cobamide remodeling phosphodiesterase CbiR n=1 Tax=Desulfobacula sp. TaxID=2593537 RepID=UPI0025BB309E|nr:cobamide remodeling phosphodiesterase CbiR [Desulfobacula sp.]MCD4718738.1 sugar phosphate isomerase/epimerase [Desulfobacula sp.]
MAKPSYEELEKKFKLGTTSFIFPDHIIPNVKKLGLFFDEIELLIFESRPAEVLPSKKDVKELLYLSQKFDLTYNIHLPIDVSLTHESLVNRQKARDTILAVIDLFAPLNPTTHTLHLDMPPDVKKNIENQKKLKNWEEKTRQSLGALISDISNPGIISIETLDYPFSCLETLVEEFKVSVCIDAGHQIKYGHNLLETFEKHKFRTSIIHLHGVAFSEQNIKDHTALDKLPKEYFRQVQTILEDFTGVVSLEVFNLENLNRSLRVLSKVFKNIAPMIVNFPNRIS